AAGGRRILLLGPAVPPRLAAGCCGHPSTLLRGSPKRPAILPKRQRIHRKDEAGVVLPVFRDRSLIRCARSASRRGLQTPDGSRPSAVLSQWKRPLDS